MSHRPTHRFPPRSVAPAAAVLPPVRQGLAAAGAALSLAAVLALGSPFHAHAAGGHDAAPEAKSSKPAKAAPAAAPESTSMDALRARLAEKVAAVRAAQAERPTPAAHAEKPAAAGGHEAPKAAAPRRLAAVHPSAPAAAHGGGGAAGGHGAHWAYGGETGPAAWGALKPEFATCGIGSRQSPIDIRGGIKVDLDPIKFDYKSAGFNVIDNGHTVQVNIGGGNAIEVAGRRYDLVQFHFHRPSEERINGRQFEMVAHLVHKDLEGKLAVVAVLLEAGPAHPIVQQVWNNLPLEKNDEQRAASAIDLSQLLPTDRRYYTYMGSLTTPPCSEGVLWLVLKQPVTVTQEQIGVFARLYANNARPIQSQAGRLIKESN
jgi:carbonic anhydrase